MTSNTGNRKFLITSALPYANGPLHFGHLAGVYLPADIYRRHRALQGHRVVHICGSDEHGVAIMISTEKQNLSYKEYVDHWHQAHLKLFSRLQIEFDFFGKTSEPYHAEEVVEWFHALNAAGLIGKKSEKQLFSIDDQKFLPDRYVEGTCYVCGYDSARGDECPNCGEWIDATKLINPRSKISGSTNLEIRETEHYYLLLSKMEKTFREWFATRNHWRPMVIGFVNGLLEQGLVDRAISRDLNWGIPVPLPDANGKRFYVWFDAPIGYVSNLKEYLKRTGSKEHYLDDWWKGENVEIAHFIGKDNVVFHAVIWPCMILGSGRTKTPTELPANHFVNLDGRQFSKSAGWYLDTEKAIDLVGTDALRFYLCSIIPETNDTNFSTDTFKATYAEFANKIGNLVHRTLTFAKKNWPDGISGDHFTGADIEAQIGKIQEYRNRFQDYMDSFQFVKAQNELLALAQAGNEFFHSAEPWKSIKTDQSEAARSTAVALTYTLAIGLMLLPIVPGTGSKILQHFERSLNRDALLKAYTGHISDAVLSLHSSGFNSDIPLEILVPRIEDETFEKIWEN